MKDNNESSQLVGHPKMKSIGYNAYFNVNNLIVQYLHNNKSLKLI